MKVVFEVELQPDMVREMERDAHGDTKVLENMIVNTARYTIADKNETAVKIVK